MYFFAGKTVCPTLPRFSRNSHKYTISTPKWLQVAISHWNSHLFTKSSELIRGSWFFAVPDLDPTHISISSAFWLHYTRRRWCEWERAFLKCTRNSLLSFQSAICHWWLQILHTDQTGNTGGAAGAVMNGQQKNAQESKEQAVRIVPIAVSKEIIYPTNLNLF